MKMGHENGVSGDGRNALRDDTLEPKHKVFLSHSGAQKGFVEQLCLDLERQDRFPFFDKRRDSLPMGEHYPNLIFQAIRQCQIGVVVLSEDYFTRTKWPMQELVAMMQSKLQNNLDLVIMPVFLNISLTNFRDPLKRKEWLSVWRRWARNDKRIDIQEWKRALEIIGPIKGLVYDLGLGEVKFREEIVEAICEVIPPEIRWDDAYIQGKSRLCKVIRERINQVQVSSIYGVRLLGIYGVGGIGKTTLCKALCNDFFTEFRGRVSHAELDSGNEIELLREVLRRLTDTRHYVLSGLNLDECRDHLKKNLHKQKAFLTLDNMLDIGKSIEQAKAYLRAGFANGSVVIVTARSLGQLKCVNINERDCLEMPMLEVDEAKALLMYHVACAPETKNEDDEECIMRCVQRCYFSKGDGSRSYHYHPLALKVLGVQLGCFGYDPKQWVVQVDGLDAFNQLREKEHPIFSILRKSFDILLPEDQLLFMDVALYLPENMHLIYKWDVFKWLSMVHETSVESVKIRLDVLKRKSLLEHLGDGFARIDMHDLWREFSAVEAKRGECRCHKVNESGGSNETSLHSCWKNLNRLSSLHPALKSLKGVNFSCFPNIIVLKLMGAVSQNCVLDLRGLNQLKSLELRSRSVKDAEVEILGLGLLGNLSFLRWDIVPAHSVSIEEIGHLNDLQVLQLDSCRNDKLPDISKLASLQVASFRGSHRVDTVRGLSSKLSNLRCLDLSWCMSLRSCHGVGDLVALQELELADCENLEELPNLQKLTSLRKLDISGCRLIKALPGLSDLVALQELRALGCLKLTDLPDMRKLTNLQVLDIYKCPLKAVPGLGDLTTLRILEADFQRVEGCPDLHKLTKLQTLNINGWSSQGLTDVVNLTKLERLTVRNCVGVSELPDLQNLMELQSLCLWSCEFKDLLGLSLLTALIALEISHCATLRDLQGVSNLTALERLTIYYCSKVERLPEMHKLTRLKFLDITGCTTLRDWHGVRSLSSLENLVAGGYGWLENLTGIHTLTGLRSLDLRNGGDLDVADAPTLSHMKTLRRFALEIMELPKLSTFPRLEELVLSVCGGLMSLTSNPGEPLTSLRELNVDSWSSPVNPLPCEAALHSLEMPIVLEFVPGEMDPVDVRCPDLPDGTTLGSSDRIGKFKVKFRNKFSCCISGCGT